MTAEEFKKLEEETRALQAQCARGFPKHMIDDSNSLHAECLGQMGKLLEAVRVLHTSQQVVTSKITTPATIEHLS